MSYDHWKTTNPQDEFLGSEYCEEEDVVDWLLIERELTVGIWHKLFCQFILRHFKLPREPLVVE